MLLYCFMNATIGCDLLFFFTFNDIKGRWLVDRKLVEAPPPPVILLLAVPRQLFWFGSLVILDVARFYFDYSRYI